MSRKKPEFSGVSGSPDSGLRSRRIRRPAPGRRRGRAGARSAARSSVEGVPGSRVSHCQPPDESAELRVVCVLCVLYVHPIYI